MPPPDDEIHEIHEIEEFNTERTIVDQIDEMAIEAQTVKTDRPCQWCGKAGALYLPALGRFKPPRDLEEALRWAKGKCIVAPSYAVCPGLPGFAVFPRRDPG